jgi:excisionase family DNA binding protein
MNTETTQPPKTLSVPEAGLIYFGMGRSASYDAAHRGEIPTIRIGKLLRVPVSAMDQLLENCCPPTS